MKKKLIAVAVAALALASTFGATTAFAATAANEPANNWRNIRTESRANVTDEQREEHWNMRNSLFGQFFGGEITAPVMSDEAIAERQAVRSDFVEQVFNDGIISQGLYDLAISSIEAGRGAEFNAEQRMANRNAMWEQISEDGGISQDLFDAIFAARMNSDRQGGGRGAWFWGQ